MIKKTNQNSLVIEMNFIYNDFCKYSMAFCFCFNPRWINPFSNKAFGAKKDLVSNFFVLEFQKEKKLQGNI